MTGMRAIGFTVFAVLSAGRAMPALAQSVALPAAPVTATTPSAQEPSSPDNSGQIADIVVTAQKRSENLQRVPISISVIPLERIDALKITGVRDLAVVTPGLNITTTVGNFVPNLRGIGSATSGAGSENPVALYVDGVYYASALASLLTLNNIAQVDVLKGPQGTLFGRNTTGGLIQVTTRDPTQTLSARASVSYGNYQTVEALGYISGGLAPNLAADVAVHYSHQGKGYGTNLFDGSETGQLLRDFAIRSKMIYSGQSTTITLIGDYESSKNTIDSNERIPFNEVSPLFPKYGGGYYDIFADIPSSARFSGYGFSGKIVQDLGDYKLTSITAYRKSNQYLQLDGDLTPLPIIGVFLNTKDKQFSQELQLISPAGRRFEWVAGLFYFNAKAGFNPQAVDIYSIGLQLRTFSTQMTRSYAGFVQGTYKLGSFTRLTAGGRYTIEKREGNSLVTSTIEGSRLPDVVVADAKLSARRPTWRLSLDHSFTPDVLGYASYNRGFKSGGFNLSVTPDPAFPNGRPYQPESIDAYEIGFKTTLFDRRLRLNGAAFLYNYSNLQVVRFIQSTNLVVNGARGRFYGLDLEAEGVITTNFRINAGLNLLHARFTKFPNAIADFPLPTGGSNEITNFNAAGQDVPNAPRLTANLGVSYKVPVANGNITLDTNYYYNDGYFAAVDNIRRINSYSMVNSSLTWNAPGDAFYIRAFGRNLLNEHVPTQLSATPDITGVSYNKPRTYGIEIGGKF